MSVRVFVEGGGNDRHSRGKLRIAWGKFYENHARRTGLKGGKPRFEPNGGRTDTFAEYKNSLTKSPSDVCLVLIDSDGAKPTETESWKFLEGIRSAGDSEKNQWAKRPPNSDEHALHFMVQAMECWFLADPAAIRSHYGSKFNGNALPVPKHRSPESVASHQAKKLIRNAASSCTNPGYNEIRDASGILEKLDSAKVIEFCPHARKFLACLDSLVTSR